ncbi:membrane protein insertase YidC, partial [Halochromatium sp.]
DESELLVERFWQNDAGLQGVKRYRFERGRYLVHASQEVINGTDAPIAVRDYEQLKRTELYDPNKSSFIHTYTGGVYYGPDVKYRKESFGEMAKRPLDATITDGWVAMIQHYFMAAWIPPSGVAETFYTKVVNNGSRYIIGAYSPSITIPAGATHTFESQLFAGPKLQDRLAEIAPGLELAVDYGWLTILAEPIFWLLNAIHSIVGNWGWAIIILTILIKAAFYKLSETSYKSMANMRKMTPRIQALKDRYGDDKEKLNQAFMELYKKEKINPLGGCLPILVQIPVFIALYWVLLESVELRHAPFILWLDNLTEPDPYYILPLIMGVSMFVQQKLNPPPPDPMQAKIFMALPFVFTVFFAFFPSGLVLYWTTNNLLSITQQWYITRKVEQAASHGGGRSGKKTK